MTPKILVIVNSDPRVSPRPAEAVRIAAGVGAWKRVEISLALCDAAVLALSEFPDDLVDEDNYVRYLPIIGEWGRPVYVERGAPLLSEIGQSPVPFKEITQAELAVLASSSDGVLRF